MKQKYRKALFIVTYIIDAKTPKTPRYLILKRKLHWKGYEFPKGGIEKYETKREALRREISEEVGLRILKIKKHKFRGQYSYPELLSDRPGIVGQTFSLYSVEVKSGKVKFDKREHSGASWLSYKKAKEILTYKDQKKALTIVNDWLKKKVK